jgi:hypothetical protein
MESRSKCIVKYMSNYILKDIWNSLKLLATPLKVTIGVIVICVLEYLAVTRFGWHTALQASSWVIVIGCYALIFYDWEHTSGDDAFLVGAISAVAAAFLWFLFGVVSAGPTEFMPPGWSNELPWIQALICFVAFMPWGITMYIRDVYKKAVEYCDRIVQKVT